MINWCISTHTLLPNLSFGVCKTAANERVVVTNNSSKSLRFSCNFRESVEINLDKLNCEYSTFKKICYSASADAANAREK